MKKILGSSVLFVLFQSSVVLAQIPVSTTTPVPVPEPLKYVSTVNIEFVNELPLQQYALSPGDDRTDVIYRSVVNMKYETLDIFRCSVEGSVNLANDKLATKASSLSIPKGAIYEGKTSITGLNTLIQNEVSDSGSLSFSEMLTAKSTVSAELFHLRMYCVLMILPDDLAKAKVLSGEDRDLEGKYLDNLLLQGKKLISQFIKITILP